MILNQNQLLGDNVDLFLAFTSEGCVAQKQHHRVNVVSHPGALDLEVPLRQDIVTHWFAQLINRNIVSQGLLFLTAHRE